jgi:tetrahydromethanopterin S-methyltransferase subunit F
MTAALGVITGLVFSLVMVASLRLCPY